MDRKMTSTKVLLQNLEAVISDMRDQGKEPSNRDIARGRDISDRMVGKIRNGEVSPTIDKLDELADYFRLPTWVLLLPYALSSGTVKYDHISKLIDYFINSDESGRNHILSTAKHEADRNINLGLPPPKTGEKAESAYDTAAKSNTLNQKTRAIRKKQ
jgi:transcriptional regulator with XRE-family HTH domain